MKKHLVVMLQKKGHSYQKNIHSKDLEEML